MTTARRLAYISASYWSRVLTLVSNRTPEEQGALAARAAAEDPRYGEPAVVETDDGVEVRLYGDVIPHTFAPWYLPGEAVSDVGFLKALDRIPADRAITVTINSLGGDVFGGTAIANAVAKRKATTQVDGIAASIASVILAAGVKAHVMRGATVMVHKPWSVVGGNAVAMRAEASVLDKLEESLLDIYVGKSGKKYTRAQWRAALAGPAGADGSWLSGAEAVATGIADTYEAPAEQADAKRSAQLLEQRKAVAALYCSQLPKHLADPATAEPAGSPKGPALGDPEAAGATDTRALARKPGVSYLS